MPTPSDDEFALLADLLSLPSAAADLNLSPQRKREMLFTVLLHQLEALAGAAAGAVPMEDLHWIDPSSRELLDRTIERAARLPVLGTTMTRPRFAGPTGQPGIISLAIGLATVCRTC